MTLDKYCCIDTRKLCWEIVGGRICV